MRCRLRLPVLTVPLLYPAVIGFGFDGIWFGIILVIMVELGPKRHGSRRRRTRRSTGVI